MTRDLLMQPAGTVLTILLAGYPRIIPVSFYLNGPKQLWIKKSFAEFFNIIMYMFDPSDNSLIVLYITLKWCYIPNMKAHVVSDKLFETFQNLVSDPTMLPSVTFELLW